MPSDMLQDDVPLIIIRRDVKLESARSHLRQMSNAGKKCGSEEIAIIHNKRGHEAQVNKY